MATLSFFCQCPPPPPVYSRFDKFTATLAGTFEDASQEERDDEAGAGAAAERDKDNPKPTSSAATTTTATASEADFAATVPSASSPSGGIGGGARGGGAGGGEGEGGPGPVEGGKRATGKEWLQTHPHGTPPTMRLAMQFDQVCVFGRRCPHSLHATLLVDSVYIRCVWLNYAVLVYYFGVSFAICPLSVHPTLLVDSVHATRCVWRWCSFTGCMISALSVHTKGRRRFAVDCLFSLCL